jgi:hypothetical protein
MCRRRCCSRSQPRWIARSVARLEITALLSSRAWPPRWIVRSVARLEITALLSSRAERMIHQFEIERAEWGNFRDRDFDGLCFLALNVDWV